MFLEDVEIQTSNGHERVHRFEFVADIGEDGCKL